MGQKGDSSELLPELFGLVQSPQVWSIDLPHQSFLGQQPNGPQVAALAAELGHFFSGTFRTTNKDLQGSVQASIFCKKSPAVLENGNPQI